MRKKKIREKYIYPPLTTKQFAFRKKEKNTHTQKKKTKNTEKQQKTKNQKIRKIKMTIQKNKKTKIQEN
jgi:ribosomal protein L9